MSHPNPIDDPSAPLLTGPRARDEDEGGSTGARKIRIFNRTISVFHLAFSLLGTLALIAVGISIAAIGTHILRPRIPVCAVV